MSHLELAFHSQPKLSRYLPNMERLIAHNGSDQKCGCSRFGLDFHIMGTRGAVTKNIVGRERYGVGLGKGRSEVGIFMYCMNVNEHRQWIENGGIR